MGKIEKEQLRKKIQFDWDKIPEFIKRTIPSKDKYFSYETEIYCLKKLKKSKI